MYMARKKKEWTADIINYLEHLFHSPLLVVLESSNHNCEFDQSTDPSFKIIYINEVLFRFLNKIYDRNSKKYITP